MRLIILVGALLVSVGTSCARLAAADAMSVLDLASAPDRYNNTIIRVTGVICDVGLDQASLQPGPACEDIEGIRLDLDREQTRPNLGAHVVVAGLFHDNSQGDGSLPRLLNYPDNGHFGNYSILVRELRVLRNGPNNSFNSGVRRQWEDRNVGLHCETGARLQRPRR